MKKLFAVLVVLLLSYLAGAFIAFDMNPATWSVEGRLTLTALYVVFALVVSGPDGNE